MEVAMLERFFLKPQTIDGILGCWLGSRIEAYVTILCDQGYSARTILRRVPILVEFASFTKAKGVGQIEQAAQLVDDFVTDWLFGRRRADRPADVRRGDCNLARVTVRQFFTVAVRVRVSARQGAGGRPVRWTSAWSLRAPTG
jgi:integrase/recombinase XerD